MGGKVRWAVSGGAPLGARLGHFFRGIGLTILEGYGLTETAGATTVNRPHLLRIGTVGRPFPGAAARIADDGEVLLAGPHIFTGYWNNPAASAEVLEADGWFHTGDLGSIDDDGYLSITGRKKELIVTAGGKNVAPAVLEDRLRGHWIVSQCMVVGDARPYVAALVTIDPDSLPAWKSEHGQGPLGDGRRPRRRPRPARHRPARGGRREPGRLAGRVDPPLPDPADRLDGGGRPAHAVDEAAPVRRHGGVRRRRRRALLLMRTRVGAVTRPGHPGRVCSASASP